MKSLRSFHLSIILILLLGCVEPYSPSGITNAPHLLVVDGFLDATEGSITVRLSRTVSLTSDDPPPAETNAVVALEEENGGTTTLTENAGGTYTASGIAVDTDTKYRLLISTQGKNYASEFVPVKITPPIESVEFDPTPDALHIMVTTEDPTGKTGYYRWKFNETFNYTSPLASTFKIVEGEAVLRDPNDYIYNCWRTDQVFDIHVATTNGLSKDRVTDHRLTSIPRESIKLSIRYSIEVQQQALTAEGYNYWLGIYKTTENVGGLFDPLPGQVTGNLYNVADTKEFVVGFFSAATVARKRIFIDRNSLPNFYSRYSPGFCQVDTIPLENIPNTGASTLLYQAVYAQGMPVIIGYTTSESRCLDCRAYAGGVIIKPDFWP